MEIGYRARNARRSFLAPWPVSLGKDPVSSGRGVVRGDFSSSFFFPFAYRLGVSMSLPRQASKRESPKVETVPSE